MTVEKTFFNHLIEEIKDNLDTIYELWGGDMPRVDRNSEEYPEYIIGSTMPQVPNELHVLLRPDLYNANGQRLATSEEVLNFTSINENSCQENEKPSKKSEYKTHYAEDPYEENTGEVE